MAFISPLPLPSHRLHITKSTTTHPYVHPRRARRPIRASANEAARAESADSVTKPTTNPTLAPPPSTFYQAITQAQNAVQTALSAGYKLLEVEFPPLPTARLESSAVGAYEVSDANIRLAIDFATKFAEAGTRVVIAFPDLVEKDRAVEQNGESEEPLPNVRFGCLKDSKKGAFLERLWIVPEVEVAVKEEDDMFVVLGASCQELPDVERLVTAAAGRPVVLFNLKLDTSRGDLGLPAFPRKDLHYRFLSTVLPVYYIRTRTYSRSMARPPYVVNYSGALYRVFPGPYQVLLDTSSGNYRRLTTLEERPPLGEVRDILTDGMNVEGVEGKQGSLVNKGYKSQTWWEEDRTKAVSNNWRS